MLHDQVFRAGFLREAWSARRAQSAHRELYRGLAERRSSLYLVLRIIARDHGSAPDAAASDRVSRGRRPCAQALHGVQELAALQIVHAISAENVLLLPDGEIKLLDLGLAYLPGVDEPDDDRLGGTTRYMAPELFGRCRRIMVPKCFRWESRVPDVQRRRISYVGTNPFRCSGYARSGRPGFGHCLARAVEPDREKRFKNAGEFASALEMG